MKCMSCGETAVIRIAQNADLVFDVDPETMVIDETSGDIAIFDHVDYEMGCCGAAVSQELWSRLIDVDWTFGEPRVRVTQKPGVS